MQKDEWKKTLVEEAKTWNIKDPVARAEKIERERIRYPKLIKDLNLHLLDLQDKTILEVGSGPISLLSCLDAKRKIAIDPLVDEYKRFHKLQTDISWESCFGEKIHLPEKTVDLVLMVNSLDHVQYPTLVIHEIKRILKKSGYFGVISCIDNANLNPHLAHVLNIDPICFHHLVDDIFETCWEKGHDNMDLYRYGWQQYKGKVGQPAFVWLGRKVTGYPIKEVVKDE